MTRTGESYPTPGGHEYEKYMRAINRGVDVRKGFVQQTNEIAPAKLNLRRRPAATKRGTNGDVPTTANENMVHSPPEKSNNKVQSKSGQATPGFCATFTEFFSPSGPKRDQDKASPNSEEYVANMSTGSVRQPPQSHNQAVLDKTK